MVLLWALITCSLWAQAGYGVNADNLLFTHLTTRNGLSFYQAECVFKDSRGFIWVGTSDGLNRYDANTIKIFRHERDKNSIADNAIKAITEDKRGNLWIGTNSGLSRMDIKTGKFENFEHLDSSKNSLSGQQVNALLVLDDGNLLIGTGVGVDLYNPAGRSFVHYYNTTAQGLRTCELRNIIVQLYQDSKKRIWVCTSNAVFLFNKANGSFIPFKAPLTCTDTMVDNSIRDIFEDHAHQLWVATWGGGLKKFNPEQGTFETFKWELNPEVPSTANVVLSITETGDRNGAYSLWLGTHNGLAKFMPQTGQWQFYRNDVQNPSSINSGYIKKVYYDGQNLLWIAGDAGVDILEPGRHLFHTTKFGKETYGGNATQFGVTFRILGARPNIWVATWYGNGLYQFNQQFQLLSKWQKIPPSSSNLDSRQVSDINLDKNQILWCATFNGLVKFDYRLNRFECYYPDTLSGLAQSQKVSRVFIDSKGIFWVFLYRHGIKWFNPVTRHFVNVNEKIPPRLVQRETYDQVEDSNGNLWIACNDGILLYNRATNSFSRVTALDKQVFCLMKDSSGNIWAGTGNGLWRFEKSSLKARLITAADGLSSNMVQQILEDRQGRIWVATGNGLTMYNPQTESFRVFRKDDGLEEDDLSYGFYASDDSRFFLSGKNHITWFYPDSVDYNHVVAPVVITGFKIFNQSYGPLTNANGEKEVKIAYTQNDISFDFAVLNFINPHFNSFYCKMEGFDHDWKKLEKGFVSYTNLDPGTYVFRVKGANNDGVLNEVGDYLKLTIAPPFYRTVPFYILSFALIVVSLYGFYQYRVNQLLKLERLRTKIATDLHDDMGATLSSISMMAHVAGYSDQPAAKEFMHQIGDQARGLIDKMDDIVWSLKPANDSLEKIFTRLCNYSAPLALAKNITLNTHIDEALRMRKLEMYARQHIYLIAKEAINNLLKYSGCTEMNLKLMDDMGELVLLVSDNGKGIEENSLREGNGLLHMKQRAAEMKAVLKIESSPAKGTLVELRYKIG